MYESAVAAGQWHKLARVSYVERRDKEESVVGWMKARGVQWESKHTTGLGGVSVYGPA